MFDVKDKINQIADVIFNKACSFSDPGLLTGGSGMSLFLYEYAKIIGKDNYYDLSIEMMEKSIDLIFEMKDGVLPTYCAGLSGVAYLFSKLESDGVIAPVISAEIDEYLQVCLKREMTNMHYDFLHGALGISYYFVKRVDVRPELLPVLNDIVDYIDNTSIKDDKSGGFKWLTCSDKYIKEDQEYNVSLSHGMSSILALLIKLYGFKGINRVKVVGLLIGCVNYILNQRIDVERYGSYFPYTSLESEKLLRGSRLSWCYGDLGIAFTLWRVGVVLNDIELKNLSLDILLFIAENRRDLDKNIVLDAGFCHGTSGIGHIFYRLFLSTHEKRFKSASDYWVCQTLKMAKFEDGLAGFKQWHNGWVDSLGVLEGIAGIGLSLLSYEYGLEPVWDEILLLS